MTVLPLVVNAPVPFAAAVTKLRVSCLPLRSGGVIVTVLPLRETLPVALGVPDAKVNVSSLPFSVMLRGVPPNATLPALIAEVLIVLMLALFETIRLRARSVSLPEFLTRLALPTFAKLISFFC